MNETVMITKKKRTLIFMNIALSCIAASMLATALTTALPSIVRDLKIDITTGQWLTSGYSLTMGIMMPLTAYLITRFSSRRLYLSGIIIFIVGLILNVIAPNFSFMMLARILQASGCGILTAMSQVIILTIFPAEKRGTAMGWYGLAIGAAPVAAPTLAGLIVDAWNWKAIFYISIAVMVFSLVWAVIVFENVLKTAAKRFDILSFAASTIAFGGITLGIGNVGSHRFFSMTVVGFLIPGFAAAVFFVYRQFHEDQPFLDLRVLKEKNYVLSVIGSMLLYLVVMGASIMLSLYVQSVLGYSASVSGLVGLPGALCMTLISPFAGKVYDRLGIRVLFITGACCLAAGNLGMFFITRETPLWAASFLNVVRNAAVGCLMMPLVTWGTRGISEELTAHGTALLTSLRTVSGAIGTAVFVAIMNAVSQKTSIRFEENAGMYGVNAAFLCMGIAAGLLLMIGLIYVKDE